MSHFFAYLSRMKLIKRWGLMRNTVPENIQEHSLQVAMVAHGLAVIKNELFGGSIDAEHTMALAVYHDVGEVITGDLATPIKYFNPEIKSSYGEIETVAKKRLYGMLPEEFKENYRPYFFRDEKDEECWNLVKAADKICAYIKCIEEINSGNKEFVKAAKSIKKEIGRFDLPEVKYFMEKFMPSFELTLDELG